MRVLITGVCGFVGSSLARSIVEAGGAAEVCGLDNLIRPGSEVNVPELRRRGVRLFHGDIRNWSDFETLPACDWVVDCAAHASVLAGVDGRTSSRQLVEHNLLGTVNLLEWCRNRNAGFILLSTSRVYSIAPLAGLPVKTRMGAFRLDASRPLPPGVSPAGITETFSTSPPVSLYGATKLASETMALEYGAAFGFPVFINRCGVLAGAGQFGRPDQGIYAYWIHSWARGRPLKYLGFHGTGHQVRDCLHPGDVAQLVRAQIAAGRPRGHPVLNVSGGAASARSLRQLSSWCADRLGAGTPLADPAPRPFDLPWIVLDSALAGKEWDWRPSRSVEAILEEIALHAERDPAWLDLSAAR